MYGPRLFLQSILYGSPMSFVDAMQQHWEDSWPQAGHLQFEVESPSVLASPASFTGVSLRLRAPAKSSLM
jgi:hypothetical protein